MLVALTVKNFKSIREARIRFGPVTCFVGHNGVGKSNLFDAIRLLNALAGNDIHEAASQVRRTNDGGASPLDLVFRRDPGREIELSADVVAPVEVEDDFGEPAKPSTTLLTYTVGLRYSRDSDRLAVSRESLTHAKLRDYKEFVGFKISPDFRKSVARGARRGGPLISTDGERIRLHGDGGSRGRPTAVGRSPLTVLGGTRTADYPTVLAAKREMLSWRVLHLEPSSMRTPDTISGYPHRAHVSASGGRIPATLHALLERDRKQGSNRARSAIEHRLNLLNPDIRELGVYHDRIRNQLALRARTAGVDSWLYGRSLSDGTLRYIALALMLADIQDRAVLCFEEPENGVHPSKMLHLVELLKDYAVDTRYAAGSDNPVRQGRVEHPLSRSGAPVLRR